MKILITGSEGYIGRFIKAELGKRHELVRFDVQDPKTPPSAEERFVRGDLLDAEACRRAVEGTEGAEVIVHLAAAVHAWSPQAYERNTVGTWNLLNAAAKAGVKRIAFSSTINVYGQGAYKIGSKVYHPPYLPIDENVPPRPEDAYGLSKLANEQAIQGFSDAYGISAYCFRLPAVWSPEETQGYHPPARVHGWSVPHPTRAIDPFHYIDIRDVVSAFAAFIEMPLPPAFAVSYLVADDTTLRELTMDLLRQYLPEWAALAGDRLPGHAAWFSSRRAKEDLGWKPLHTWRNPAPAPVPAPAP